MNYALKLDNVCKTYEMSDFVLDNVSFAVPMGSVMGFVGENGAGKTTTIGCILNTLSRNSGSIQLFGKEKIFSKFFPSAAARARLPHGLLSH